MGLQGSDGSDGRFSRYIEGFPFNCLVLLSQKDESESRGSGRPRLR